MSHHDRIMPAANVRSVGTSTHYLHARCVRTDEQACNSHCKQGGVAVLTLETT